MTITDRIKQQGKPLDTIEKECGLGSGTISKWKNSSPSVDKLLSVAQYLNVSLDFLVGYDCPGKSVNQSIVGDGNSQNAYGFSCSTSPLEESVLLAMRKMTDAEKARVIQFAYEIIDKK